MAEEEGQEVIFTENTAQDSEPRSNVGRAVER